jgi:hypothetical protein
MRTGIIPAGWEPEVFETGYVLEDIIDEVRMVPKKKKVIGADGKPKIVTVKVPKRVQFVLVRHPDKERTLEIPVGKKVAAEAGPEEEPVGPARPGVRRRAPGEGESLLERFKRLREQRERGRTRPEEPGEEAPAGAPSAPEGWKKVESLETALRFLIPADWAKTSTVSTDFDFNMAAANDIGEGRVMAFRSDVQDSGVVVVDREVMATELEDYTKGEELDAAARAERVCEGVRQRSLRILVNAKSLRDSWTLTTSSGGKLHAHAISFDEGKRAKVLVRYCTYAAGRFYALAFVCKEADAAAEQPTFAKIAESLKW